MGFARKNDEDRVRRNAPRYNKVQPEWDGHVRGPELPPGYCDRVMAWWETWRTSAQAMVMIETDWESMLDTAILKEMYCNPNAKSGAVSMTQLASEIRRRESAFGATFEDRLKLAIEVDSDLHKIGREAEVDTAAEDAVNYMENLTKAAADKKG
jgi:hypothetical protein